MDRIKKMKIKKSDGTLTDYIPIGVDAKNVDLINGNDLEDELENIYSLIEKLREEIENLPENSEE